MDKVESVDVDQSILGRILDYGNVIVNGTGDRFRAAHDGSLRRSNCATTSPASDAMARSPTSTSSRSAEPPARLARRGGARPCRQSACRHGLCRALHRARIHHALPDHRPAGLRASRHRLCAGQMAGRIEVAEALPRQLPQPRRVPRGLHGRDRQAACRSCSSRNGCASAATGIRAAACRSTCSGRRAGCRRASGCPTRASRPIADGAEPRQDFIAAPLCIACTTLPAQRSNTVESHRG